MMALCALWAALPYAEPGSGSCSSAAVTVCAADVALRDLTCDTCPTDAAGNQRGYVGSLITEVIELKDHDVGLAAIDAGVC